MEIPSLEQITHVVFHHSAGPRRQTFEQIERFHVKPKAEGGNGWLAIGYHIVILGDGTLRQGRRLPQQGAHAPGYNTLALGVCLVGDNTKPGEEWSGEQIITARRYIDALDLVAPGLKIIGHRDTGKATACPGVDRASLLRMLGR